MKKGIFILLLGFVLGTAAFAGIYYAGTAASRRIMSQPLPELAWLKKEFNLSDNEFARVSQLHQAYLPMCEKRCQIIAKQTAQLRELFARNTNVTAEISDLLTERAKTRAECEAEMLKQFLEVSRSMPSEQGKRYLTWVQEQTFLHGQVMEQRHQGNETSAPVHHH